jgi:PAS domain S-box-containing protein
VNTLPILVPWLLFAAAVGALVILRRSRPTAPAASGTGRDEAGARLWRSTLESIGDGVIVADLQGNVLLMNAEAERITGWTEARAAGRPLTEVLVLRAEATRERVANPALVLLRDAGGGTTAGAYALRAEDGEERLVAEKTALIRGDDGKPSGLVQVLRDVTDERKRSAEAAKAGKLESLGLLAGGIAHDFGNLIAVIAGNVTLAQQAPDLSPKLRHRLGEIERVVLRARDLTEQLKTFAKGGELQKKAVRLEEVLREAAGLGTHGSEVRLHFDLEAGLPRVEADELQLVRVVNNVVLNAVQAMGGPGNIWLSARRLAPELAPAGLAGRSCVRVSIRDDGPGMAEEVRARIFDPFFTTKEGGTGLGLATAYSVIEQHGGRLTVDSEPGKGSTFHFILPAVE